MKRGLIVALGAVLVVLSIGCGRFMPGDQEKPVAAEPRRAPVAASPAPQESPAPREEGAPAGPSSVVGVWVGTYLCAQGVTGLRLTITGNDEALTARFKFEPVAQNPGVPKGEFAMAGSYRGQRLQLDGGDWIDRPGSYVPVDIRATFTGEEPMRGEIVGPGCTTFEVTRGI